MRLDYRPTYTHNRARTEALTFKNAASPNFQGASLHPETQVNASTAFYPAKPIPWAITGLNKLFSGLICKPLNFKIQCHNPEKLAALNKPGQGLILTMNHSSLADKSTLLKLCAQTSLMPLTMASLTAAGNHLPIPLIWPFLSRLGIFSVNEGNPSVKNTKRFAQNTLIKAKYPLCIFPEGKINWNNAKPGSCQKGTMQIALNAANEGKKAMKVVPIGITYQYDSKAEKQIRKTINALEAHILSQGKASRNLPAFKKLSQNAALQEHLNHLLEWVVRQSESANYLNPSSYNQTERIERLRHKILSELKVEYGVNITDPALEIAGLSKAIHLRQHNHKRPPLWIMLNPWAKRRKEYKTQLQKIKTDIQKLNHVELLSSCRDALPLKPNPDTQMEAAYRLRYLILNKPPHIWNVMRHCTAHIVVGEPILVAPKPDISGFMMESEILRLTRKLQVGLENAVKQAREQSQ